MKHDQTVGQMLRDLRERRGWSQRQLAREAGVTDGTVRLYEKGTRSVRVGVVVPVNYQPSTLAALAGALEVDPEPLLTLAEQAPTPEGAYISQVVQAILDDPHLIPEARDHLVRAYDLLLRLQGVMTEDDIRAQYAERMAEELERHTSPAPNVRNGHDLPRQGPHSGK